MQYNVNKGVGRSFEFKGLRSMYVFMALGGVMLGILLYFLLGLLFPFWVTMSVVMLVALGSVLLAYYLNNRMGEHGIRHFYVQWKTVQRIQNDQRVRRMLDCG